MDLSPFCPRAEAARRRASDGKNPAIRRGIRDGNALGRSKTRAFSRGMRCCFSSICNLEIRRGLGIVRIGIRACNGRGKDEIRKSKSECLRKDKKPKG